MTHKSAYLDEMCSGFNTRKNPNLFRDTLRKQAATRAVPLPEGALDSAFRPERYVARLAPVFERLARLS